MARRNQWRNKNIVVTVDDGKVQISMDEAEETLDIQEARHLAGQIEQAANEARRQQKETDSSAFGMEPERVYYGRRNGG